MDAILPPSELPLKFRRKSSSASSTGSHLEFRFKYAEYRDSTPPFSPFPSSSPFDTPCSSSSPPFFPKDLADDAHTRSATANDFDSCQDDVAPSWRYRRQHVHNPKSPQIQEPSPLLSNKYGFYLPSDDEPSMSANFSAGTLSDHSRRSQLFSSDRNSESADEEEYEFETLDTRIRRTYFAVSEERGRWQSSPIPVRTHIRETFPPHAIRPIRRHSNHDTTSFGHDNPRSERLDCATGESYSGFAGKVEASGTNMLPFSSPISSSPPNYASSPGPTRDQHMLQVIECVSGGTATPTTDFIHNAEIKKFGMASTLITPQDEHDDGSVFRFSSPLPPSSLPASPMSIGPSGEDSPRVDPMILNEDDSAGSFETLCSSESNTSKSADDTPLYLSRDSPFNTDQTTDDPSPSAMTSKHQPSLPPIISPQFKEEVATTQGSPQPSVPRLSPPLLPLPSQVNIPSGSKLSSQRVFSKAPLANKKNEPHPGQDREKVDSLALRLDFDVGATANVMSVLPSRTETPTGISLSTQSPLANNERMDASTHVPKGRKANKNRVKREDHEASLADSQDGCSRKRRKVEKGEAPDPSPVLACKNRGSNRSKKSDRSGRKTGTSRSRSRIRSDKASGDEASRICNAPSSSLPLSPEELPPRPGSPSLDPHLVSPPSTEPNAQARVELTGMLVECLGTSRASSMAPSALYTALIRSHPALKTVERTKREWITLISSVLEEVCKRCGMFGRVESSGKDEKDRPLEARWFYVPEKDEDQERAVVITSLMPRPAKRSETKKYKQYYYRPLDKISRWDPEDAI